jgi:hypothetical protein
MTVQAYAHVNQQLLHGRLEVARVEQHATDRTMSPLYVRPLALDADGLRNGYASEDTRV